MRAYRVLVEKSQHLILVLSNDLELKVLYANSAVARVLDTCIDSVLGRWVLK